MVMQGASSLDKVFDQDAMAPRSVFDSPMFGIGSFTDVEIIWIIRPYPSLSIPGTSICVRE